MARKYVSNRDESVRIFRSDLLERLSYVHPALPHALYLPIIAVMLIASLRNGAPVGRVALMFAVGLLLWAVAEYVIHRFLFHVTPELEADVREIVERLRGARYDGQP